MRKQFPVPKGLRTRSFASRYRQLRKLRKMEKRKNGEQKSSNLLVSNDPLNRVVSKTDGRVPFGAALLVGFLLLIGLFYWLSLY
jgi:hypothetical protein